MKISTTALYYSSEDTLENAIRFCAEAGFDALDLNTTTILNKGDEWERTLDSALKTADDNNIHFEYTHLPFNYPKENTPENWDRFNSSMRRAIDIAAVAQIKWAVIHPRTYDKENFDLSFEKQAALEHLLPFVDYAAGKGVGLAVENMRPRKLSDAFRRYCSDVEELCDLVDSIGGNTGVCWDFGHANITGLCQSEALTLVGSRLKVIHVNDNFATGDIHIAPFTGTVDWKDAMLGLKKTGYAGSINYEVSSKRQPPELRRDFAAYLIDAAKVLISYLNE